jgi:hypothetical protein
MAPSGSLKLTFEYLATAITAELGGEAKVAVTVSSPVGVPMAYQISVRD